MKFLTKFILIVAIVLVILIAVIIKSFNRNEFGVDVRNVHQMTLVDSSFLLPFPEKGSDLLLIDIRDRNEFMAGHSEEAINIPFRNILNKENRDFFSTHKKDMVIYSDDIAESARAWSFLRQLGCQNIYIAETSGEWFQKHFGDHDTLGGNEVFKYKFQPDTTIRLE